MRLTPALLLIAALPAAAALPANLDRLQPDLSRLATTPRFELPVADVVNARRLADTKPGIAQRFAVGLPTALQLSDGSWETTDSETAIWRLRLHSNGARSLNLELARVRLPAGAQLWLYDSAGKVTQGPYTAAHVNRDGRLWTAAVAAEDAVLELRVPPSQRDAAHMQIVQVNHGYRDILKAGGESKSGSCNIDTVCAQANAWRDDLRSVARITIGGTYLCTGQLINNVRQDLTPFFITADHCLIGESDTPAESVVFYWNYATSSCGGAPDGSLEQNQSGSTFVADNTASDFTLVRLAQTPPAEFNIYYAGFDISGVPPQSGAGIHHPQGDEKRISLYDTPATQAQANIEGRTVDAWRVNWSQGTTEQGSSGSGLWNQDHRLIGVLSGGEASCDNRGGNDFYGRLDVAWTAEPQAAGQLKAHLDPDDSGVTSVPGRDPTRAADPVTTPAPAPTPPPPTVAPAPTKGGSSPFAGSLDLVLLALFGFARFRRVRRV